MRAGPRSPGQPRPHIPLRQLLWPDDWPGRVIILTFVPYSVLFYLLVYRDLPSDNSGAHAMALGGAFFLSLGLLTVLRPQRLEGTDRRRDGAAYALMGVGNLAIVVMAASGILHQLPRLLFYVFLPVMLAPFGLALALFLTVRRAPGPSR